jgi:signal transduction histidine kinase
VLSDHGLPAALEELASTAPIPLVVRADGVGRLPAHIEQAAYFVAAEGLANMIKHARATKGSARIAQDNETLIIEIADNGIGGANTAAGSGLRGLNDRVGALDGLLQCDSPPGGGTVVRAEIPCAS